MKQFHSALAFVAVVHAHAAFADEFTENFDDGTVDAEQLIVSAPPGFAITFSGGQVLFEKQMGTGNGFARITSAFTVKGDFSFTAAAERVEPAGILELGIAVGHLAPVTGFTDVYYYSNDRIISNVIVSPIQQPTTINDGSAAVVFRIRRVGDQIFHEFDSGTGFQQVASASHPNLAGPVNIQLFLGQENSRPEANSGTFDDLSVVADAITPACGNGVLGEGEACDDDDPAWQIGEYCNVSCEIVPCGDPNDSRSITATDALFVLQAGVALAACDACVCDVNGSGGASPVSSTDALMVLNASIGLPGDFQCPPCL